MPRPLTIDLTDFTADTHRLTADMTYLPDGITAGGRRLVSLILRTPDIISQATAELMDCSPGVIRPSFADTPGEILASNPHAEPAMSQCTVRNAPPLAGPETAEPTSNYVA